VEDENMERKVQEVSTEIQKRQEVANFIVKGQSHDIWNYFFMDPEFMVLINESLQHITGVPTGGSFTHKIASFALILALFE
jgi:hypothetical protein